VQEAEHQFKLALALNPAYHSAVFNLGLTYQHLSRWGEAIAHFRRVTEVRLLCCMDNMRYHYVCSVVGTLMN
jgi:tetratricopeptide (TPR) repeat protein